MARLEKNSAISTRQAFGKLSEGASMFVGFDCLDSSANAKLTREKVPPAHCITMSSVISRRSASKSTVLASSSSSVFIKALMFHVTLSSFSRSRLTRGTLLRPRLSQLAVASFSLCKTDVWAASVRFLTSYNLFVSLCRARLVRQVHRDSDPRDDLALS